MHCVGQGHPEQSEGSASLLPPQNDFALAHHLVIQPHSILVITLFRPHSRRTAQQTHPRRRLKHVRRKRAAVHIKLDAQIPRIRNPRNLVPRIQHHRLRDQPHQHRPLSHFPSRFPFSFERRLKLPRQLLRRRIAPSRRHSLLQYLRRSRPQPHAGSLAASPPLGERPTPCRLRPHKHLLLLRSQLNHPPFRVRISQSRKQLPPAHSKIRMLHVRALKSLRKTQSQPPKLFRRHNVSSRAPQDNISTLRQVIETNLSLRV